MCIYTEMISDWLFGTIVTIDWVLGIMNSDWMFGEMARKSQMHWDPNSGLLK